MTRIRVLIDFYEFSCFYRILYNKNNVEKCKK